MILFADSKAVCFRRKIWAFVDTMSTMSGFIAWRSYMYEVSWVAVFYENRILFEDENLYAIRKSWNGIYEIFPSNEDRYYGGVKKNFFGNLKKCSSKILTNTL